MSKTRPFAAAIVAFLGALASAAPAQAQQEAPRLFGRADFELEWKVEPVGIVLSARYLAARGLMRLEVLDGQSRAVVRNLFTGDALYVIGHGQGGVYSYKAPAIGLFQPESPGEMSQVGPEQCRNFDAGGVSLCITDDGIPLKMTFPEGTLTASRLLRQPQHPAMFELPKGVEAKPLPPSIQPPQLPF